MKMNNEKQQCTDIRDSSWPKMSPLLFGSILVLWSKILRSIGLEQSCYGNWGHFLTIIITLYPPLLDKLDIARKPVITNRYVWSSIRARICF